MDPYLYKKPKGWDQPVHDPDTLDLFGEPTRPLTATADYQTSREAAEKVAPVVKGLRAEVYRVLLEVGAEGLTDPELERLPVWHGRDLGPSTLRKRRGELVQQGYVIDSGRRRDGCIVWRAGRPGAL